MRVVLGRRVGGGRVEAHGADVDGNIFVVTHDTPSSSPLPRSGSIEKCEMQYDPPEVVLAVTNIPVSTVLHDSTCRPS